MAINEQYVLEISAKLDQALRDVNALQEQVAALTGETATVDVAANVEGAEQIGELGEEVETLDGTEATVELDAEDDATDAVEDAADAVEDLDGTTAEVTVEADTSDATAGLDALGESIGGLAEGMSGLSPQLGGLAKLLGGAGGATLGVAGLGAAFGAAALSAYDFTQQVEELALFSGQSTEEASRLLGVLQDFTDISLGQLENTMGRVQDKFLAMPGLAAQIGVNIDAARGPLDLFVQTVDALNSGQLTAAERIDLGMQVFGRNGLRAVNEIEASLSGPLADAMADLAEERIISQEDIARADQMEEAIGHLKGAIASIAQDVGEPVLQILSPIIDLIAKGASLIPTLTEPLTDLISGESLRIGNLSAEFVDFVSILSTGADQARAWNLAFGSMQGFDTFTTQVADATAMIESGIPLQEAMAEVFGVTDEAALSLAVALGIVADATAETEQAASSMDVLRQALRDLQGPAERFPLLWSDIVADLKDTSEISELTADHLKLISDATGIAVDELVRLATTDAAGMLDDTAKSMTELADETVKWADAQANLPATEQMWDKIAELSHKLAEGAALSTEEMLFLQEATGATGLEMDELLTTGIGRWDEMAAAIQKAGEAIREAGETMQTAESRADGIAEAFDRINDSTALSFTNTEETLGFVNDLQGAVEALSKVDLSESDLITSDWNQLLDEDLQGAISAVGQLRQSVQSEMGQAFAEGGPEGMRQWADSIRGGLTQTLEEAGKTDAEIREILEALGLTETQVDVTIAISQQEQVLSALDTIVAGIEGIPANKLFDIQMAINNNDPQTAVRLINEALISIGQQPINVTFAADGTPIITTADEARTTVEGEPVTLTAEAEAAQAADDLLDVADEPRTALIVAHARYAGAVADLKAVADTPRTAYIEAQATGVLKADSQLDSVAKPGGADRRAYIVANPYGVASAEGQLNNVARDRTADIFVQVHNAGHAAGQISSIPGVDTLAAPTMLGAPAAVATAGAPSPVTMVAPAPVQHVNVSVNAGVIGNRWDLQRIIARAVRSGQRLNGRRSAA